jgi:activator of 2-hydroxyglutaryl-CoA dehydratase
MAADLKNNKSHKIAFTGGVAQNTGVQFALETQLYQQITVPGQPQLTGALGAAIIAAEGIRGRKDI